MKQAVGYGLNCFNAYRKAKVICSWKPDCQIFEAVLWTEKLGLGEGVKCSRIMMLGIVSLFQASAYMDESDGSLESSFINDDSESEASDSESTPGTSDICSDSDNDKKKKKKKRLNE